MPTDDPRFEVERRDATPAEYRRSLEQARARTMRRQHGPVMTIDPASTALNSPFSDCEEEWRLMVLDTFGTRSHQVGNVFVHHLASLCSSAWSEEAKRWAPNEDELTSILHIVAAHRPRNEAEAALAAQIAATHVITMKVAKFAYDHPFDHRTVGTYAKLARASAQQVDTMARLKGKRRTSRHQIVVTHEKHIHQHQHVHVEGGAEKSEGQSHATRENRARLAQGGAGLPSPDEDGRVMPLKSCAR